MVRPVIIPLQFYNQFDDPDPNSFCDPLGHRLINYLDTKTKCRHLQKFRDFAASFYLSEAPSPPMTPYPPPPVTHCMRVYSVRIHTGKGEGGKANQREG
jgi:hypothetical protein